MKKILFPVILILFVVGGVVAGDFARNSGSSAVGDGAKKTDHSKKKSKDSKKGDSHKKDTGHKKEKGDKKKKDKKKKDKKKKDDHGKSADYGGADSGENVYLKFKRQFVVPVMDQGSIEALVIMNLNLELNQDAPSNAYSFEPKLRDAIMRELLQLSNAGIFGTNLTSAENYEKIREQLLHACQNVIKEGIDDILILDIARQEQ